MLKPASSLCNMRCKYCFYANVSDLREVKSFGIMQPETVKAILNNTFADLSAGDNLTLAFQGGEPTMAGLDFFKAFVKEVKAINVNNVNVSYALQTNGLVIDDNWAKFLKENNFLVGLSLDGYGEIHDSNRVDNKRLPTYKRVMLTKKTLDKYQVEYNVLMTLTSSLARHPAQIFNFIKANKLRYVQFTPCLADFDSTSVYALTPEKFYSFYKQIFSLWLKEFTAGNYISIKLFDDLVNLLAGKGISACGLTGHCSAQIVVEADGGCYPCDFYMLDKYKTGDLTKDHLMTIFNSEVAAKFRSEPRNNHLCATCRYRTICNGGCKRMIKEVCYGPDDTECMYKAFLDEVINSLITISKTVY